MGAAIATAPSLGPPGLGSVAGSSVRPGSPGEAPERLMMPSFEAVSLPPLQPASAPSARNAPASTSADLGTAPSCRGAPIRMGGGCPRRAALAKFQGMGAAGLQSGGFAGRVPGKFCATSSAG